MADNGRPAILVQSVEQFRALNEQHRDEVANAVLIGLAPRLGLGNALRREHPAYMDYTDLLEPADYNRAEEEAYLLSQSWLGDLPGATDTVGADVIDAIRPEVQRLLAEMLLAQRFVSATLNRVRPSVLILLAGVDPALEGIARYEAEQRGVAAQYLTVGAPQAAVSRRRSSRVGHYVRQVWHSSLGLIGHGVRQILARRPVLLGFGAGVDLNNQRQLMPTIQREINVRPVLVSTGHLDRSALNRPSQSHYPYLDFIPVNNLLFFRRHLPGCRQLWAAFRERQAHYQGPHPFLFANPHLDPVFKQVFLHLLPHAAATRQDVQRLLRLLRPRLVLTNLEVSFATRLVVLAARERGIPSLGVIHSGLNNMYYRDYNSTRMAVWGKVHVRDFVRVLGRRPSELKPIGNPQYDTLNGPSSESDRRDERPARVLVVTAVTASRLSFMDLRVHRQVWAELERLPAHGIQVIVKPHPRFDDYAFYRDLKHQLPDWRDARPGIAVAQGAFLEEVLPECDLVVVPSLPTTGAVEAMLCGKPVLFLAAAYAHPPFSTAIEPGCEVVRQVEQVCPVILDVLRNPTRQAELVARAQGYLDDLLGPRDGQATHRLAMLISRMVEQRA